MSDWSELHEYTEENVNQYAPTTGGVYRLSCDEDESDVFWGGPHWSDTNLPKLSYR